MSPFLWGVCVNASNDFVQNAVKSYANLNTIIDRWKVLEQRTKDQKEKLQIASYMKSVWKIISHIYSNSLLLSGDEDQNSRHLMKNVQSVFISFACSLRTVFVKNNSKAQFVMHPPISIEYTARKRYHFSELSKTMHTKLITNKDEIRTKANASDHTKSRSTSMRCEFECAVYSMAIITLTVFHMPHALQTIVGYNVCKCVRIVMLLSQSPHSHSAILCVNAMQNELFAMPLFYMVLQLCHNIPFAWNDVNGMEMKLKAGANEAIHTYGSLKCCTS